MKIGIMQPYFLPYIGYWQLLNAVDRYVLYDDVNFIKGGWINRNKILIDGQEKFFNIQMIGASSNKHINEILVDHNMVVMNKKKRIIQSAYSKAPFYTDVFPILEQILDYQSKNLADFLQNMHVIVCNYLDINTELILSSQIEKDNSLRGQDKVIQICKILNGTEYYNAIGGMELYSRKDFENVGIKLSFIKSENIVYKQFNDEFMPNLSLLDVMMFNSKSDIRKMLTNYQLIQN